MNLSVCGAIIAIAVVILPVLAQSGQQCHEFLPNCAQCDNGNLACQQCKSDSASAQSSAICVKDCTVFGTHRNDAIAGKCVKDCGEVQCDNALCSSDKSKCADLDKASQCPEWSFLLPNGECSVFGCPSGFFRSAADRSCQKCDNACQECEGPESDQCTLCSPNKYLQQGNGSTGTCSNKSQSQISYKLFVSNEALELQSQKPNQQRDGTSTNPFIDIRDAIDRAYQLTALLSGASVTIFFTTGDHYVLPQPDSNRYAPARNIPFNVESRLTFKPLPCGEELQLDRFCVRPGNDVRILVKIGAYFTLPAPEQLTIQNLTFDYSDSLLLPDSNCLKKRSQACIVDVDINDKFQVTSVDPQCPCRDTTILANQCNANHPHALIDLVQKSEIEPLKSVTLNSVKFQNIFTNYNSLIGFDSTNGLAAQIKIIDSQFTQISMCGAVINSFIQTPSSSTFPHNINAAFLKPPSVVSNLTPFKTPLIQIKNTLFSKIGLDILYTDDTQLYQTEYRDLRFEAVGQVLNLGAFPGEITIQNSEFVENKMNFNFLRTIDATARIEFDTSLVKSKFGLIKQGVIAILQHTAGVKLIGNTFKKNSGLRGPVLIQIPSKYDKGVFIYGNTFIQNTGWVRSNVLSLRSQWQAGFEESCTGYYLENNKFIQNSNLPREVAQVYVACIPTDFVHSDGIDDISGSEFLHSHQLLTLFNPTPKQEVVTLPSGQDIAVDYTITKLKNNEFIQNFRGKGQGNQIITMYLQRLRIQGINLIRNGDVSIMGHQSANFEEFWRTRSGLHAETIRQNFRLEFNRLEREVHPLLGDQLLFMGRVLDLTIDSVNAIENWYYQGFENVPHFLSLVGCTSSLNDIKISKLISGEIPDLFNYILSEHEFDSIDQIVGQDEPISQLEGSLINANSFTITNSKFQSFYISNGFIEPNTRSSFVLENIKLLKVNAYSFLRSFATFKVKLSNCDFSRFSFNSSSILAQELRVEDSVFDNSGLENTEPVGFWLIQIFDGQKLFISNSRFIQICGQFECTKNFVLSVRETNFVEITNSTVQRFRASSQSQMLAMSGGTLVIKDNCYFKDNTGIAAGVFNFFQTTNIQISDSYFYNNTGNSAGVFELRGSCSLSVKNSFFQNNRATTTAGIVSFAGTSKFEFLNSEFLRNSAGEYGSIAQGVSDGKILQRFDSCVFKQNIGQNTMSIFKSNIEINDAVYEGNFDYDESSSPMYFIASKAKINRAKFNNVNYGGNKCNQGEKAFGGFIFGMSDNDMTITDSSFESVCARKGGAIFVGVFTTMVIENSLFKDSKSLERGGAIYATNTAYTLIKSSRFEDNKAVIDSADIFIQDSAKLFEVVDSTFTNSNSNPIFGERSSLNIENSTFSDISIGLNKYSVVKCSFCFEFDVKGNQFNNIESFSTVNVEQFDQFEGVDAKPFRFLKNRFTNINTGNSGGALSLQNPSECAIQDNVFSNITSKRKGGAIFYKQLKEAISAEIRNNEFKKCKASEGGAIFWSHIEPLIDEQNSFENNEASLYARNIGSYARNIQFISSNDGISFTQNRISVDPVNGNFQVKLDNIQTGKTLPSLYIAAFDKYGQVVTTVNNGTAYLLAKETLVAGETPSEFKALLSNENTNEWVNGVLKLDNLKLNGEPGKDYEIAITSPKIDETKPDRINFLSSSSNNQAALRLQIDFRLCQSGEKFVSDGACVTCPKNSFLIDAPRSPQDCLPCPQNAICYGGNRIGPQPGFWRSSFESINLIPCLYGSSCEESFIGNSYQPEGTCRTGYFGTLCGSCETGYTRSTDYKCSKCPPIGANVAILIFISLILFVAFVFFIKLSLKSQKQKKSVFTVYFKIILSHLQLLMLISTFDLEWPEQVRAIFNASSSITDAPQEIFSFDCFLQTSLGEPIKRYYLYLIIYFLIPFFIGAATVLFWKIKQFSNRELCQRRAISTFLICFFLVHPSVSKVILGTYKQEIFNISCISIDDSQFMVEELSEQCWQGQHITFTITVGLLSIVLWTVGLPIYSGQLLKKNRDQLDQNNTKEKFGFLYNGYQRKSYYWEIVIQLRKVLIAFVSIFLTTQGTIVQSLALLCILGFFIIVTLKVSPFEDRHANHLEILSLMALIITTYCGVFYLSARNPSKNGYVFGKDYVLSEFQKWVLFLVILSANLFFLGMWVYRLAGSVKQTMIKKLPKCYFCFCACFNRTKMIRQISKSKKFKENEELVTKLNKICNALTCYGSNLEKDREIVEQPLVCQLVHAVSQEIERIEDFKENKRRQSLMPSNKKRLSNRKIPTKEILDDPETGRSESGPSSRRHIHQESRDSKDFFFNPNSTPKASGVFVRRQESVDDEVMTSEGNVVTTEGPMMKSKFSKVHPSKKSTQNQKSLELSSDQEDVQSGEGKKQERKKFSEMDFWNS